MTFEDDTKKILEFFEDEELQEIFENNFMHKQRVKDTIDKLDKECRESLSFNVDMWDRGFVAALKLLKEELNLGE